MAESTPAETPTDLRRYTATVSISIRVDVDFEAPARSSLPRTLLEQLAHDAADDLLILPEGWEPWIEVEDVTRLVDDAPLTGTAVSHG